MFSCEFSGICKNTLFTELLQTALLVLKNLRSDKVITLLLNRENIVL